MRLGATDVTVPGKSFPRAASARTTTFCPTFTRPASRSSTSARTRKTDRSPITARGSGFDGDAMSAIFAVDLQCGIHRNRRADAGLIQQRLRDRNLTIGRDQRGFILIGLRINGGFPLSLRQQRLRAFMPAPHRQTAAVRLAFSVTCLHRALCCQRSAKCRVKHRTRDRNTSVRRLTRASSAS